LAAAESAFGSITTVVYAAGIPIPQAYVGQAKQADWRKVVDMDLHGFFRLVQAALPALRRSRGSLVAVTTAAAQRHIPRDILSSAPKAAVEALVRGLAREEGRFGVRANCVAPGLIEAGISVELLSGVIAPMVVEKIRQDIALKRFGTAEEVAEAVAFLASDRARYITGQVLSVDGGWLK
jgi:NAD(P)-dependent dehydrogenase (short-subunit alcohol dehydrogenase family)